MLLGTYLTGNYLRVSVVEKKPANLIVRGTFDQGVTADDRSVAFGAAASETFTAPAGETLISVTVNGVAQQIAEGATSFTYEAAELTQYVYIDMQSVEPQYTATYTGSENVIITNTYDGSSYEWGEGEEVVPTQIACLTGTVLSFYPTEGNVITNVTIGGVEQTGFDPACYTITVISDTNLVVLAGVQASAGYTYPEGGPIEDAAVVAWLTAKGFTPAQVTALGSNAKLNECYLLNCDITQANAGGSITITGIEVGASGATVTVRLDRVGGYEGGINGTLELHGKADLATGEFANTGATVTNAKFTTDSPATATLSGGTAKFFRAVVE